jgi:hypothetical protein
MKPKHTPGPWVFECKQGGYSSWIGPDTGDQDGSPIICVMERDELIPETDRRKSDQYTFSAEQVANARLIAAAPDLLWALEKMLREHDALQMAENRTDGRWPAATYARAMITKARGTE